MSNWLTVIYKSGAKVHFKAKDFKVAKYTSGRLEYTWEGIDPRPLLFGADEVAAVWEGKK